MKLRRLERICIGLGVGSDSVRAVAVRGESLLWAAERATADGDSLDESICELLRSAPVGRWPRPRVIAAIGPSFAQLKHLHGLPELREPRMLRHLVNGNVSRLFLRNGVPLLTAISPTSPNARDWAAAFDVPIVHAVESGCRAARLRLECVLPSASVVGAGADAEAAVIRWRDGNAVAEITISEGQPVSVRRIACADLESPPAPGNLIAPLRSLGDDAWRFADAYGAARADRSRIPALARTGGAASAGHVSKVRAMAAILAAAAAILLCLAAPRLWATRVSAAHAQKLAELAEQRAIVATAEQNAHLLASALEDVSRFSAGRQSQLLLLRGLATTLGAESAIISLRTDSAGGSMVAVAPRGPALAARLEKLPWLGAVEIVGPVTPERIAGRDLERVTLRFRFTERRPHSQSAAVAL